MSSVRRFLARSHAHKRARINLPIEFQYRRNATRPPPRAATVIYARQRRDALRPRGKSSRIIDSRAAPTPRVYYCVHNYVILARRESKFENILTGRYADLSRRTTVGLLRTHYLYGPRRSVCVCVYNNILSLLLSPLYVVATRRG